MRGAMVTQPKRQRNELMRNECVPFTFLTFLPYIHIRPCFALFCLLSG